MSAILDEVVSKLFWRDVSVEVVATFMMMSVQCSIVLPWDLGEPPLMLGNIVQIAMGMGFVVCALAWTFGDFGGCHMNPAVSFSMILLRKLSIIKGIHLSCTCMHMYFLSAITLQVGSSLSSEILATYMYLKSRVFVRFISSYCSPGIVYLLAQCLGALAGAGFIYA